MSEMPNLTFNVDGKPLDPALALIAERLERVTGVLVDREGVIQLFASAADGNRDERGSIHWPELADALQQLMLGENAERTGKPAVKK